MELISINTEHEKKEKRAADEKKRLNKLIKKQKRLLRVKGIFHEFRLKLRMARRAVANRASTVVVPPLLEPVEPGCLFGKLFPSQKFYE